MRMKIVSLLLSGCLSLSLITNAVSAQVTVVSPESQARTIKNAQPVIGRVLYDFTHLRDTTQKDKLYKEVFELSYGKTTSMFTSITERENDSLMRAQVAEQFKNAPDPAHVSLKLTGGAPATKDKFFTNKTSNTQISELKTLAYSIFLIESKHPTIGWKIIDSTKLIGGYVCQKATGNSYGRLYTAWFCTDLPYSFGPRRLNGLPGLILEAYDEKMEVVYRLKRVEDFNINLAPIGIPENAEVVTAAAYKQTYAAFKKNPRAFFNAGSKTAAQGSGNNASDGMDANKIKSIHISKAPGDEPKLVLNNPIDLVKD